jgi:hypothetical protein
MIPSGGGQEIVHSPKQTGEKMFTRTLYGNETNAVDGTSFKGYIKATRSQLESVFGKPSYETPSGDDKVTTEWVVEIDGTLATIYDWKRYELGTPDSDELIYWNIGGKKYEAAEKVAEVIGVEVQLTANFI